MAQKNGRSLPWIDGLLQFDIPAELFFVELAGGFIYLLPELWIILQAELRIVAAVKPDEPCDLALGRS